MGGGVLNLRNRERVPVPAGVVDDEAIAFLEATIKPPIGDLCSRLTHTTLNFSVWRIAGEKSVLEHLHRTLGEKYRPCPLLVQYVKAGRLGRKVGRGVYEY